MFDMCFTRAIYHTSIVRGKLFVYVHALMQTCMQNTCMKAYHR